MTDTQQLQPTPIIPPVTFNFAESEYDESKRNQRNSLIGVGVTAAIVLFLAFIGHSATGQADAIKAERRVLLTQKSQLQAEITKQSGGVADLPKLVADRQREIDEMMSNDISVTAVLQAVRAATPQGTLIKSISVTKNKDTGATATTAPAGGTAAAGPKTLYVLTVVVETSDIDFPALWQGTASSSAALVKPKVDFPTAAAAKFMVTLTAGIKDEVVMSRRELSRATVGTAPPTTAAPSTTAATTTKVGG